MRVAPVSIAGWRDLPRVSSAPDVLTSTGYYLLAGSIVVDDDIEFRGPGFATRARYFSATFEITVHYPDGTFSNSPRLALNSGGLQNTQEKTLEDILKQFQQSNGHSLDNSLIGVNNSGTGFLKVNYILIPDVVEAVIKNRMVRELFDYRSQSAQNAT